MYYRVHWASAPKFGPENAWSAQWGSARSEDGSQTVCHRCDGTGREDEFERCEVCSGTGWEDAIRGYSCCRDREELVDYMALHGSPAEGDEVIIFEGRPVGAGPDGEALVIPTAVARRMTWEEFVSQS